VHAGWLGAIQRAFDDSGVFAVTGLVLPAELGTPAQFALEGESRWDFRPTDFDNGFFRGWSRTGVPTETIGESVNMAFRREAFERVGSFDERLGAGASGGSEDTELWYRVLAEGYRIRYEPAAVVFHTHRDDWNELSAQTSGHMRGRVAALLFQFDRHGHRGNIYRACVTIPTRLLRLAFRAFKRSVLTEDSGKDTLVLPLMPQVRGVFAGYGYYLRHRWHRAAAGVPRPGPVD
jgi:GT2 family glycosyltransferase